MITDWIKLNCDLLKIPYPAIKFSEPSFFKTPTTQACIVGDLDDLNSVELHLNSKAFTKETPFFKVAIALAHELRHYWQIFYDTGYPVVVRGYKTSDELKRLEEYNEQELELDAWAWACYLMQREFNGCYPTFDFIGDGYTEKVLARAEQIKNEMESK